MLPGASRLAAVTISPDLRPYENARGPACTPSPATSGVNPAYQLRFASSREDVRATQRLRFEVFSLEFGAVTGGAPGLDQDRFDDLCDHLMVWHTPEGGEPMVVATYRLLPPPANESNPRANGLYAAGEFDLEPIESLLGNTVEAGRACVHPDHRNGATMALLWGGIARYMQLGNYRYLLGCGSLSLADGGAEAGQVWEMIRSKHLGPVRWWCRPRRPWRAPESTGVSAAIPALMKGYLRLGATVIGAPAHDPAFGTADLLVLLDLDQADPRYLRFFLGAGA